MKSRIAASAQQVLEINPVINRLQECYMDRSKKTLGELAIPIGAINARAYSEKRGNRALREQPPEIASDRAASALAGSIADAEVTSTSQLTRAETKAALEKLEDADLLRRFQSGEEHAFYVLFERRHKEIYMHCYRMCNRDGEKANDAFQDTFMKVFQRKDLFTDATNGRAWLYRIATNTCLNAHRYDRRHPTEGLEDNVTSIDPRYQPDFGTEQSSLREALESAVAKLPEELRQPFILRELDELSYEDVAEHLGITIAAARQRIYRAKILLREELEDLVNG
ncbi:MAG: RNA polymerase sigma factor [Bacteroidota bacterium]|nr:RNA polymerase sigma factor [Bacteroidota bacterium]